MSNSTRLLAPTPTSSPRRNRTAPNARLSARKKSASSRRSRSGSTLSDARWIAEAAQLGEDARGRTAPNPNVGSVLVRDGAVIASGATSSGGRPHAEAVALALAGAAAQGATLYTTLEPCAHVSERGPTCAAVIPAAGIRRVVVGVIDPDLRTAGKGVDRLRSAGVEVIVLDDDAARDSLSGFLMRIATGRPRITLKL
ncbi:MAG: hypothetical protein H0W92_04150, partial [Sphingomonas sp.]|nr:hypothetical protein [Sphingomonas sp.]